MALPADELDPDDEPVDADDDVDDDGVDGVDDDELSLELVEVLVLDELLDDDEPRLSVL